MAKKWRRKEKQFLAASVLIAGAANNVLSPTKSSSSDSYAMFHQMIGHLQQTSFIEQHQEYNDDKSSANNHNIINNHGNQPPLSQLLLNSFDSFPMHSISGGVPINGSQCQCMHCGKYYSNTSNLRQHVRNVHTLVDQSKWHECNKCGKKLKTKHYLINHQLQAHGIHQRAWWWWW